MQKRPENFKRKKFHNQNFKISKPYYNKKKKKYYFRKKRDIYYFLGEKRPEKPLTTEYLHRNKKKKTGIFFKKPTFRSILYPFHLNLNLINEYLKKK